VAGPLQYVLSLSGSPSPPFLFGELWDLLGSYGKHI